MIPAHVDWLAHRIASSHYYPGVGLLEVKRWTMHDIIDAHIVLDAMVEAERPKGKGR